MLPLVIPHHNSEVSDNVIVLLSLHVALSPPEQGQQIQVQSLVTRQEKFILGATVARIKYRLELYVILNESIWRKSIATIKVR